MMTAMMCHGIRAKDWSLKHSMNGHKQPGGILSLRWRKERLAHPVIFSSMSLSRESGSNVDG